MKPPFDLPAFITSRLTLWVIALSSLVGLAATQTDNLFEVSKSIEIFADVYKTIHENYVDEQSPGTLIKKGIDAMLATLDPYTVFYPESRIEEATFQQTGQYGGIGINTQRRGKYIVITDVFPGFGASKAGIAIGDKIIEIGTQQITELTDDEAGRLIKGEPGTTVTLTLEKATSGNRVTVEVKREEIKNKDVPYFGIIPGTKTGYIKLDGFTPTAASEVRDALVKLKSKGATELVLDLRGNGGGLMMQAISIVNFFVPKGTPIVETRGKKQEWKQKYAASAEPMDVSIPLVVLIDNKSASASEIVAGSLQDLDRAVVVGEESFGKGLVQQTVDLAYNTKMKFTVAKYYTPSGRCVQRLDYSHRDDKTGKVTALADSVLTVFKTKKGRPVTDGRGVQPDVTLESKASTDWIKQLNNKHLIFDFITQHPSYFEHPDTSGKFHLAPNQLQSFETYLEQEHFAFETPALQDLKKIRTQLTETFPETSVHLDAIEKAASPELKEVLQKMEVDLMYHLEQEGLRRQSNPNWLQKHRLVNDPVIQRAMAVLEKQQYDQLLSPHP